MKTLTSIQALATLAALGGAILVSATPADARGGHGSITHASFTHASVTHASFRTPRAVTAARFVPKAVQAAQLANPGHVNSGSTSMIRDTPNGPVFDPSLRRRALPPTVPPGQRHVQPR